MIISILIISFLQMLSLTNGNPSNIRYNPLLSAQCKARCLHEYRNYSHHHRSFPSMFIDGKTKRLLSRNVLTLPWRSIWERCPRLITCSSCLLPCDLDPPLLLSNKRTCQAICSTLNILECEQSCLFIQNLYEQEFNCFTGHCQSCAYNKNCSEEITEPWNVIAVERKSRRTVRLKWHANQMTHTEPVFYVIEAQWTLPRSDLNQYELVSKWGFVKEEVSNTKAIIRNIQRDNRCYKFRVAAVTRHGHSGFSVTKKSFRLTNQSEVFSSIISSPKNFSIKDYQFNSKTMNITLRWEPPDSSANGYQISWQLKDAQSSRPNTIDTSLLELLIPFLSMDKTYLFQIRSMIISKSDPIELSFPRKLSFNYDDDVFTIKTLQISKAYFLNGLIKANISWTKLDRHQLKQYDISWIESDCQSEIFSCCYRRDAVTIQNHFQLYDLRFNCTYLVNITTRGLNKIKSVQFHFNVSSCQLTDVYGTIRPPCQTMETFSSLPTLDLMVSSNQSGLNLVWANAHSSMNNLFYQLRIEQLPNHRQLVVVALPLMITNYWIPYVNDEDNRYLNVTLSLMDDNVVRQEQSILIDDKRNDYFFKRFQHSSSTRMIPFRWILFVILFNSFDR